MASKSGIDTSSNKAIEEALDAVDSTLDRLKTLYEQYFLGIQKQAPAYIHNDVERKLRDLTQLNMRNTSLRYRLATLQQKFGSYNSYWRRTLRQIENGTYLRNLAKIGRDAARNGAEIPEEILAAMPKRMREQVLRDRDQALAIAKRRHQVEGDEPAMAEMGEEPIGLPDDLPPSHATPHRDQKTRDGALVLDENDADMDFDAFFSAFDDDAPKPEPRKPISQPVPRPAVQRLDTEPDFSLDDAEERPAPRPSTPTAMPTTAIPRTGMSPPNRATGPIPAPSGMSPPNRATGPIPAPPGMSPPNRATGPIPAPPGMSPPNRATGPIPAPPTGAIPRPVVPSPSGSTTGIPRPVVPSPSGSTTGIPRPVVPSPSGATGAIPRPIATQPSSAVPTNQTGAVPLAGRQTGPVPIVGRQTGPVPTLPPNQSAGHVGRETGGVPVAAPTRTQPIARPPVPSQAARPNPVAPGAAAKTGPVGVESMSGPFPRTQPIAKPQQPGAPQKPPPGMTEADVNALHAKYIQAKQMVGEKVDAGSREKLLKTINQTAPKIMEQYKASGVDFSVVVKDNQVVIKAKPKT